MDIGKLLLSYFLSTEQGEKLKPIIDALAKNDFDITKTLKNTDIFTLLPAFATIFENKKAPTPVESVELAPISNFASEQVVNSLNEYFSAN
jgi:hypothetical protein